ncbi:MAG: D-alanine--D-alanine ligase family protein [bacterium]
MIVGLTYDLKEEYLKEGYTEEETAELDLVDTIEAIEGALQELGFGTDRIGHIKSLTGRLAGGDRWDLVFNIAEGLYGFGREAQIPCLLDAYGIPYTFSDPLVLSLTLHKGMTKRIIRDFGIPTPAFAIVEREGEAQEVNLPFPLFAKPIAEGTSKGISGASKVTSRDELVFLCGRLLSQYKQPILVEAFLSGREFTVGIVGTGSKARSIGALEILLRPDAETDVYSYFNKKEYEALVTYRLAQDMMAEKAEELALLAWRGLGCRDGGRVDVRADDSGQLHFIEVNPLAGLHPEHSDLPILCTLAGIRYHDLIGMIMSSALERLRISCTPTDFRPVRYGQTYLRPAA